MLPRPQAFRIFSPRKKRLAFRFFLRAKSDWEARIEQHGASASW